MIGGVVAKPLVISTDTNGDVARGDLVYSDRLKSRAIKPFMKFSVAVGKGNNASLAMIKSR